MKSCTDHIIAVHWVVVWNCKCLGKINFFRVIDYLMELFN